VTLNGFLIHPVSRAEQADLTLVYLHGISMDPNEKIPELKEFANTLNCQIVMFNYRGYSYSDSARVTERGI
jgi:predicted alpha/beta-fold hydrolase